MPDKQVDAQVQLSVRIPARLKHQLDVAARARRSSLSAEVTHALTEQYARLGTDKVRLAQLGAQVSALEAQLTFLESTVLLLSAAKPAKVLEALQSGISRRRVVRLEATKEAARRAKQIRKAAESANQEDTRRASPFDGLINPTLEDIEERAMQLPATERRRLNLLLKLDASPRGAKSRLAALLGWTRSRVTHLLAEPHAESHRPISDDTARRIEIALQLSPGALDRLELDRNQVRWHQTLQKFDAALAYVLKTLPVPVS